MNKAKIIVDKFGGQSALAKLLGKGQSTVRYWVNTGIIPPRWQPVILQLAKEKQINILPSDFVLEPAPPKNKYDNELSIIHPPKPASPGQLELGITKQIEIDGKD